MLKHRNILKKFSAVLLGTIFVLGLLSSFIPINRDVNAGGPEVLTWKNRNSFEWAGAEGNPVETFRIFEPPISNGSGGLIEFDPADKTGFQTRVELDLTDDEQNSGRFCEYINVVLLVNTSDYNNTWNNGGGATPIDELFVNEYSHSGCSMNDRMGIALDGLGDSTIEPALPTGPPGGGGGDTIAAEWVDRAHIKITRGGEDRIFTDGDIFDDQPEFTNDKDDCESKITLYDEDGNLDETRSPQNRGELDWESFSPNTSRCSQNAVIGGIDVEKGNGPTARRIIWFQRVSETKIVAVDGNSEHEYEKVSTSNTKYNNTDQGECPDQVVTHHPAQTRNIGPNRFELVGTNPRTTNDTDGCNDNDGNPRIALGDALMYEIGQAPPGADGTTDSGFEAQDCDAGDGLTWIICPTIRILAGAINSTSELIEEMLEFPPDILANNSVTFNAWKGVRNLANIGLILVFVLIIYSQATGGKE